MSLAERLADQIRAGGPMTIAQFMTACLHDPLDGYYATRPALGAQGDFITAPLVSQMFGELIGLWAVETWRGLGRPSPFRLIEAGPGDGTLMADLLRAARVDPGFLAAAELWLVETSAPLRQRQVERLGAAALSPRWAGSIDEVPPGAPILLIANELLDCLPPRQFVRTATGWAERLVGLDEAGNLTFGLNPVPAGPAEGLDAPPGSMVEVCAAQAALGGAIGGRIARDGGAALLIDYGRDRFETGDTLQALMRHQKVDVLKTAGQADLTVHADFPAVLEAARREGCAGAIRTQRDFLRDLGIEARAAALARAQPGQAPILARQLARLIDHNQMGVLFKAACLFRTGDTPPPAFEAQP
ncbi:MAG: SAM-dependent methyltransferase [Caulobacteraceae bacterium]|nr:SAM-dependent methyltransferase [Caulobacteraceae bacterium]